MAIISLQNINLAYSGHLLLDQLNLQIEKNQRVCLLGRNGTGKSTLMKIISGREAPDSGIVQKDQSVRISYFAQEIPMELPGTVFDIIANGLDLRGELLLKYHGEERRQAITQDHDHTVLNKLHEDMDTHNVWAAFEEINTIISRMNLDADREYLSLSGGQKRRALLAAALVSDPDLLLLDEPTNHLDIDVIAWLEEFLLRQKITLLFVTHDRMLLRNLATRIIELDRGKLVDWSCDYDTFIKRKQAFLDAEEKEWADFDKKLAEEEVWIRKGIRARRTRNEGRVRALMKMREERRNRRMREGSVSMQLAGEAQSGKLVIEANHIFFSYDDKPLINDFTTRIIRGDKIGIIGPNGCGKTTLVNLLLTKIAPSAGSIKAGTNLSIAYYDQFREQLDEEKSVWENVLPNGNMVTVDGRSRHIVSYLQDFLFTPERSKSPVSQLSGGERNRLLLARLFTQPANVLVFDEPTNDLDAETLELLEELLIDYKGTILLISHDRVFINNIVTSVLVFTGAGGVKEYIGGYDDWLAKSASENKNESMDSKTDKKKNYQAEKKARQKPKLSFKDKKELASLPALIESLEAKQNDLHVRLSDPEIYQRNQDISGLNDELEAVEKALRQAYARWEHLESVEQ